MLDQTKASLFLRDCILSDLLDETSMLGCRPADSPIETNHHPSNGAGDSVDKERYHQLVGKLIYLSQTQLDNAYAVS